MRSRIIGLAVWCSVLAIVLFGVPLAVAVLHNAAQDTRSDLARSAREISIEVSGYVDAGEPIEDFDRREAAAAAVYDGDGDWLGGDRLDEDWDGLDEALGGGFDAEWERGRYVVAVPVTHGDETIGAVMATTPQDSVWRMVLPVWGGPMPAM